MSNRLSAIANTVGDSRKNLDPASSTDKAKFRGKQSSVTSFMI